MHIFDTLRFTLLLLFGVFKRGSLVTSVCDCHPTAFLGVGVLTDDRLDQLR